MLKCSKNQKKAAHDTVDLVFVPYETTIRGGEKVHIHPDGRTWCWLCHFRDRSGDNCCSLIDDRRRQRVPCRAVYRTDRVHGYWKEVKE